MARLGGQVVLHDVKPDSEHTSYSERSSGVTEGRSRLPARLSARLSAARLLASHVELVGLGRLWLGLFLSMLDLNFSAATLARETT